jgi:hypothetical protein
MEVAHSRKIIVLPSRWPKTIKSSLLRAISLASNAMTVVHGNSREESKHETSSTGRPGRAGAGELRPGEQAGHRDAADPGDEEPEARRIRIVTPNAISANQRW